MTETDFEHINSSDNEVEDQVIKIVDNAICNQLDDLDQCYMHDDIEEGLEEQKLEVQRNGKEITREYIDGIVAMRVESLKAHLKHR